MGLDGQVHHAMLAYLLKHVVKETKARRYVGLARPVEVYLHVDLRLFGVSLHLGYAFPGKQYLADLVPCHAVLSQDQRLASHVFGQLRVALAVADDPRVGDVVVAIVHVFLQHARPRLSHGRVVLRKMTVYQLVVERDAFALQCLENEVVHRPKGVLWERWCAQSILIAHHDEFVVEMSADECEVSKYSLCEF